MAGLFPTIPPITYPTVNGVRYDFTSIEFGINGIPDVFAGITEIEYNDGLKPGELRGNRPQIIGRSRGKYEADASITLAKAEWQILLQTLQAQAALLGLGFMEYEWDLTATFGELGVFITDQLIRNRITKVGNSNKEAGDPSLVKVTLQPTLILYNGALPFQPDKILT